MEKFIMDYLRMQKKNIVNTEDMIKGIRRNTEGECFDLKLFSIILSKLVKDGVISPVVSRKLLYYDFNVCSGYRIMRNHQIFSKQNHMELYYYRLLEKLNPEISKDYYEDNLVDFMKDWKYIEQIHRYFEASNNLDKTIEVDMKQRSYEIFKNESMLEKTRIKLILKRLKITYQDLRCFVTPDPFVYHINRVDEHHNRVLIVEDKVTFVHLIFESYKNKINEFNLIILAEERDPLISLEYLKKLVPFDQKSKEVTYFGDIEPHKIINLKKLRETNKEYNIRPYYPFYEALLDYYSTSASPLKRKFIRTNEYEEALAIFPYPIKQKLTLLFDANRYIPQAAFNIDLIKR